LGRLRGAHKGVTERKEGGGGNTKWGDVKNQRSYLKRKEKKGRLHARKGGKRPYLRQRKGTKKIEKEGVVSGGGEETTGTSPGR